MSKHRKRKKSFSGEEDVKESKNPDVTKESRSAKWRTDSWESTCASNQERSPSAKDVSQSTRQTKKPVYRLATTQATEQKPVNKDEERAKTKKISFQWGNCLSKAKNYISKTWEQGPSKPLNNAGRVPQRTEVTSESSSGKMSSHRSPSTSKKQLISTSSASAEQKEEAHTVAKRMRRAEEPLRAGNDSNTIKPTEPPKTSLSSKYYTQKRRELVKEMCQRYQGHKFKAHRSQSSERKSLSASSSSTKHTTSVSTSNVVKRDPAILWNVKSESKKTPKSESAQQCAHSHTSTHGYKIPKRAQPSRADRTADNNEVISTSQTLKRRAELSDSKPSTSDTTQKTFQQGHSSLGVTPSFSPEGRDKSSSVSDQHTTLTTYENKVHVVEELHLARSEKRLEVNVMRSYGELTSMDIDPPDEGATDTHYGQAPQQLLILVLDTNILLSHLNYVKRIRSHGLGLLGLPVVLIPWVVLQELDYLKMGKDLSGSVAHLARPAISYIYNSLKSREPNLWGQSMQQAAERRNDAENSDDRVLQCCLQYQSLYQECALILCTDDKNLCSKALLSGVRALSKKDLEAQVERPRHDFQPLQNIETSVLPSTNSSCYIPDQPQSQATTRLSELAENDRRVSVREDNRRTNWDLDRLVSELEDCLREVLSDVLEVEMKAAYQDLWLDIVYIKPPWTLQDVLHCLKKHWIAVFGQIVNRRKVEAVVHLIQFFGSGDSMDRSATLTALQEAKSLVKEFGKSSSGVPSAISAMDNIFNKLQSQEETPAADVAMNDVDEDKPHTSRQVSHQDVWALFENIWCNMCHTSSEVFVALGFDSNTMQSSLPAGGPPPLQDALVCLHKLSSIVSQLLQVFSSILSSAPSLEEVQTLLTIIRTNEIVNVDSRLTAEDFLNCFSQEDYREKMAVGSNQLMGLKVALDNCVGTVGQHITLNTLT